MKLIYYQIHYQPIQELDETQPNHDFTPTGCFYIPELEVLLFSESRRFGKTVYTLNYRTERLEEARAIAQGKVPQIGGVEYKNIKTIEYDGSQLQGLIEDIKLRNKLDRKIQPSIEDLFKKVE